MVEGVARQLDQILDDYVDKLGETAEKCIEETARDTVNDLKNTNPKGKRDKYAKSWAVKKDRHTYIVHNKKYYSLTHLLNNGHVIANQYGEYGRYTGDNHIGEAEERASKNLIDKLEAKI